MYTPNNNHSGRRMVREVACVLAVALSVYALPFSAVAQAPSAPARKAPMSTSGDAPSNKPMADMHKISLP